MYFSTFPQIYYDFKNYAGDDTFLQVLTDITSNVRIRKNVLENISLYDEYDIEDGDTPEMIAEKIYGNPEYHWIIMLANQRYDYRSDFPLTSNELHHHIVNTYGADRMYDVHHYERDGIIEEAIAVIKVPHSILLKIKVHDFIMNLPYANARIDNINLVENTIIVRMDFGRFKDGDLTTVKGVRYDDELQANLYTGIVNFNIPTNGFALNENYTPITNYEYEQIENEKKRRIRLISPALIDQILREFNRLMEQ